MKKFCGCTKRCENIKSILAQKLHGSYMYTNGCVYDNKKYIHTYIYDDNKYSNGNISYVI